MNATANCALTIDGWSGPTVQGCRDDFDFTLSFEQYIFTILPASALLIVAPLRIFHLRKLPAVVGGSLLRHLKLVGSVKPSSTLNAYLLISIILDVATLRTLWRSQLPVAIQALATASFGLKASILVLEATEKRRYILDKCYARSPEETSGIYAQGFFLWLNSLLGNGFRQLLKPTDLFPVEEGMSAAVLDGKFWKNWHRSFTICQPLLLSRFLSHLQNTSEPANIGYGLVAAYGFVYIDMAVSSAFYYNRASRMATMLRGMLVSAVYRKTIGTSVAATDESASVTLMSTDVEAIARAARFIHDIWADIVQVAIATWLLSRQIGPAAVVPIIVCLLSLGLTFYMSPKAQGAMGAWVEKVQRRVGITSRMLGHMKGIKISGLTKSLAGSINQMRTDEIKAAAPFRLISSLSATVGQIPILLAPFATFAFFAIISLRTGQTFEATRVFSSLSFVILLAAPLFGTLEAIFDTFSALACFERIQKYLNKQPRRDGRRMDFPPPGPGQSLGLPLSVRRPSEREPLYAHNDQVELTDTPTRPAALQLDTTEHYGIQLRNSYSGWTDDGKFVINNVSFVAKKNQFVLLAGPVASGKSTLLKGLLGEVPFTSGTVTLSSHKLSWCDQTPWLTKDFAQLPDGDDSMVGSKGISLSGGQKQRVALARAVYSKPEIALFDDIFSGLDERTANLVCTRLFSIGEGLLRSWGTTVILATQSACYLSIADLIIMLGQDGSIEDMGTLPEVSTGPGFPKLFSPSDKHTAHEDVASKESTAVKPPPKNLTEDATPNDKRRQLGDRAAYGFYYSSLGVVFAAILLVLEVFTAFFQTFPSVWLKWWTDASAAEGNNDICLYLGVYAALQVAGVISFFAITWFVLIKIIEKSGLEMHRRLLHAVVRAPLSLFTTEDTGSITTKFSQDLGQLDHNLPMGMLVSISSLLVCIAQAVLIASATWYLAISFPVLIGVIYCLQKVFLRTSRQLRLMDLEEKAPIYTQFMETLAGLTTIRAFSREGASTELNHDLVDRSQKPFYLLLMVQQWLVLVLDLIVAALALLVVGLAVRLRDTVSIGFTGVSLVQLITFAETAKMLIQWWTSLETSIGAVSRIKQFTEDTQDENLLGENQSVPENWSARGSIEIGGISASYGAGGRLNKALDDVTISVKAGEKVGIVGRTGRYGPAFCHQALGYLVDTKYSGKSSLLLTVVRMLDIAAGSITVDGLDLATLPREEVRSRLITITQDHFFLPGTVRQNIDPYESSTVAEIIVVLSKVGLWDAIQQKGGLDADFDEEMLSHGQRQLFFLARAILRKDCGRLVLLDEATSRSPTRPPPAPRRPQRRGPNGRRVPPGPPPPRSWLVLSQSRHAPSAHQHPAASHIQNWPLPGAYYPDDGSLIDVTLRHMAADWVTQRDWNRFYLYTLSGGMRSALLYYVSTLHEDGISAADIRLVLGGPPESELAEYELEKPDVNKLNKDIFHLDLTGSVGKGLSLKSLTDLLFVTTRQQQGEVEVQDSWDAPELISEPTKLLPNLTHLSLAMSPTSTSSASWKQLLALASKLPTLTHLSLSGWPAPSLTPNAMAAKVVSPVTGRAANYGATNHYSHILDDDWSEAVLILRKLSKALYSLVYLDLTGCGDWFPALRKEAEGESSTSSVDWASDWGKIEVLRLCSGYAADPDSTAHLSRLWDWKRQAVVVEKNIRSQRAGRGRFITVEMDELPDLVESPVGVNAGLAHNA
ncbi:uncharacterized protein PG986_006098 [Apiospora aurea]|uniref:ABC transporter n=1 Tax=Apiospora aurea TaxID=335848 RepID=A0ABR1QKW1_9PEZI